MSHSRKDHSLIYSYIQLFVPCLYAWFQLEHVGYTWCSQIHPCQISKMLSCMCTQLQTNTYCVFRYYLKLILMTKILMWSWKKNMFVTININMYLDTPRTNNVISIIYSTTCKYSFSLLFLFSYQHFSTHTDTSN